MTHRKFSELMDKMPPGRRARVETRVRETLKEIALAELRKAKEMTQRELAETLNVDQAAISKLESRADMHLSTLAGVINALGGKLKLRAEFPDGESYTVVLARKKRPPAA